MRMSKHDMDKELTRAGAMTHNMTSWESQMYMSTLNSFSWQWLWTSNSAGIWQALSSLHFRPLHQNVSLLAPILSWAHIRVLAASKPSLSTCAIAKLIGSHLFTAVMLVCLAAGTNREDPVFDSQTRWFLLRVRWSKINIRLLHLQHLDECISPDMFSR